MDLAALSDRYGDLYVPAFAVRVDDKDLLREHAVAVTQAEVDLTLGGAGRFSFAVADAFDFETRQFLASDGRTDLLDLLAFGAPIKIAMGYGDVANLQVLIEGIVTQISTSFTEGAPPELSISGYDNAFPMMGGKNTRSWVKQYDSAAVIEIAGFHGLKTNVLRTKKEEPQIEQNQEGDLEFLNKLAQRNGYEVYVSGNTLHFHPPNNQGSGVVTLEWGKGLLNFKPDGNLAGQVSRVEVYGWDAKTKDKIVGKAVNGDEPGRDPRSESGGDKIRTVLRKQPVLRVRQPVFDQADASEKARALLKENAEKFVTGEGETIGLPDILPDHNITLGGLGRFSKTYYVREATHRFDSGGYRTRFKVKENTLWKA
ncbi:phage protein D [Bradyrhizobium sp. AZCC 1588]|uniref:phage late control D family protein n=1 Tax=unclassified Bradyrhizobium TaxID=2631580 RepID=UPI002FF4351B